MPNVYMNEVERVQTIGPNGIGVYPPVPVEDVQELSNTGREMKEVTPKANRIPNPIAADEGSIMKNKDQAWQEGDDEDSLPDPATATDGMVVMASGGKWIAADASATTDVDKYVADAYSPQSPYEVGDLAIQNGKLYKCKTAIPTGEAWTAEHWEEKNMAGSVKEDVSSLKSGLSDFTKKVNLITTTLNATISNIGGNYTLYPADTENIICFPVTSGKIYTVYKGYTMPYARIAYSSTVPALNGIVTGYGDFSSQDTYKTFTASQTGYACVKIHAYNDAETAEQALASCMVYEGLYDVNKTKQQTDLINIVDINGVDINSFFEKTDCIEQVNIISDFFQGIISNNVLVAGTQYALSVVFPVVSGTRYTLDKKVLTPYTRIGYTANPPKAGDTVTNYSALDNNNGCEHITFTAAASGYATIFVSNTTLEQVSTIKSSGIVYKGDYRENYSRNTYKLSDDVPNANHIFYCGASRKLNTLVKGITEATKYMDSVLYVDAGTYDLVQELGQSYFDNATENTLGIILKNRVHIIFSSNSKVISNYSGSNIYAHYIYSPFNAGEYGFTLENLNLYCSNCRYAIHDERMSSPDQYVNKYINCKMYTDNSNNPDWSSHHCIGGGLGANGEVTIENCVFGNDDTAIRWGISYHIPSATQVTSYRSVIVIKDCYFESGTVTLQTVEGMSPSTSDNSEYIITNNSFSKKYDGTDAQGVFNTFTHSANVREWNNECRT